MKTIEELKAEQAKAIVKLETEIRIAEAMPTVPKSVMAFDTPWVSYECKTLAEAVAIFKQFTIVPVYVAKGACTEVSPWVLLKNTEGTKGGPYAAWIGTNQGEGFGPTAELVFYAQTDKLTMPREGEVVPMLLRVSVRFGAGYIGNCPNLAAEVRKSLTRNNRIMSRWYQSNQTLSTHCDSKIEWASGDMGPIKKSAMFTFLFESESEDPLEGTLHENTLDRLEAIAQEAGV